MEKVALHASRFFGGTAYLGIPHNQQFKELVFEGIGHYGVNHGASRNNNISLNIFSEAERVAAFRCNAEDAIIVSSGYLAAQLVVQHYLVSHKLIYAPHTHPALWIGKPAASVVPFNDWIENTISLVNNSDTPTLIISNSLNNLFPEIYHFDWLKRIDRKKKIVFLADDSHGIGITGEDGSGIYSSIPDLSHVDVVVVASMAKGIGIDAGVILSKSPVISEFRNSPVYAGSSPPSPGMLYAYIHAAEIYHHELLKLKKNMKVFKDLISGLDGLHYAADFPVFRIQGERVAERLIAENIIISAFPYPDPRGESLNRIVINSTHQATDIERLASVLTER